MGFMQLVCILNCYLLLHCQQIVGQFGGMGNFPLGYNGVGIFYGGPVGYPTYEYNPQYPMYGAYPCYTSIYCGGSNSLAYGGFSNYYNNFNRFAFTGSGAFSAHFRSIGGFFG